MTAVHGEATTGMIEAVLSPKDVAHLSSFALELLIPNGGPNVQPGDLYPEQIRQFATRAIEASQD